LWKAIKSGQSHLPTMMDVQKNVNDASNQLFGKITKIKEILENRKAFLIYDLHISAYILNPKLKGEGLSDIEKNVELQYILRWENT
jgi:hypothetical protein